MKLLVTIRLGPCSTKLTIPAGSGDRTFKWLALATVQHLALQQQQLRRRTRLLAADELVLLSSSARPLPKDVYSADACFLHPEHRIKDHVVDGGEVTVELHDEILLDEYGAQQLSRWSRIAFHVGQDSSEEREHLIAEKEQELERVCRRREQEALRSRLDWERPRLEEMKAIMTAQLRAIDATVVQKMVKKEWEMILSSGALDRNVKDETELTKIFDFFSEHYIEITELYRYYAAVNSGGSGYTLEYIEFSKFLSETNTLAAERHSSAVQKLFLESHVKGERRRRASAGIEVEIGVSEFLLSLVKISYYKFITIKRKELSILRRNGRDVFADVSIGPFDALTMLWENHLRPVIEKMPAAHVKTVLASNEVMLLLHEHLKLLSLVFRRYGKCFECEAEVNDDRNERSPPGCISINSFQALATDASLINAKDGPVEQDTGQLTTTEARMAFSASVIALPETEDDSECELSFAEFLEAIARLGIMRWGKEGNGIERVLERFRDFFDDIVDRPEG